MSRRVSVPLLVLMLLLAMAIDGSATRPAGADPASSPTASAPAAIPTITATPKAMPRVKHAFSDRNGHPGAVTTAATMAAPKPTGTAPATSAATPTPPRGIFAAGIPTGTWTSYTGSHRVKAMAVEGDWLWVSTMSGIVRWDMARGEYDLFTESNSGLGGGSSAALAIETGGIRWFAAGEKGVTRFDGTSWTNYNATNSGLAEDQVTAIAVKPDGVK